jgi:ATP-dependent Clp protease ATP-binding subunit ClpA
MFERFTDKARRSLVLAQVEAQNLNHHFIGTEHILLGLLAEGSGVAGVTLSELGLTLERVREVVGETIGQPSGESRGRPPFTPRAKKVLELALREALGLGHNYIGTEHILLGLLREGSGVAAQVLIGDNIPLARAREAVLIRIDRATEAAGAFPPKPPGGLRAAANITPAAIRMARETPGGAQPLSSHHYLLALFADPNCMAAKALTELGVTRPRVEETLRRLDITHTSDAPPAPQSSSAPLEFDLGRGVTLRIADRDLAQRLLEKSDSWDQLSTRLSEFSHDVFEFPDDPPLDTEPGPDSP